VGAYYGGVFLRALGLALAPYVTPPAAATANWARRWWQRAACRGGQAAGGVTHAGARLPQAITGYTRHGLNQAISRDGVGVSTRAIMDAFKN
jgi:hypothetical protein